MSEAEAFPCCTPSLYRVVAPVWDHLRSCLLGVGSSGFPCNSITVAEPGEQHYSWMESGDYWACANALTCRIYLHPSLLRERIEFQQRAIAHEFGHVVLALPDLPTPTVSLMADVILPSQQLGWRNELTAAVRWAKIKTLHLSQREAIDQLFALAENAAKKVREKNVREAISEALHLADNRGIRCP